MSYTREPEYIQYQEPQRQPSFMDQLAQGLGSGLSEGITGGAKQAMRQSIIDKTLGMMNQNMSPMEKYAIVARADPETQAALMPYLQMEREQQGAQAKQQHDFAKIRMKQEGDVNLAKAKEEAKAKNVKQSGITNLPPDVKNEVKSILKNEFNLIKKGNLGNPITTGGVFNKNRQRAIGNVKSQNLKIYEIARKMEQTGHMTDANFQALQSALVDPTAMDEDNFGRLEGLAQIMGIDPEEIFGKGFVSSAQMQGSSPSTVMSAPGASNSAPPGYTQMIDPQTGQPVYMLESDVEEALSQGFQQ